MPIFLFARPFHFGYFCIFPVWLPKGYGVGHEHHITTESENAIFIGLGMACLGESGESSSFLEVIHGNHTDRGLP